MSNFPQYSNVEKTIQDTLKSRLNNQVKMSGMMPWIRIASAVTNNSDTSGDATGCIISSNITDTSFESKYGTPSHSGAIGRDFNGNLVKEESPERGLRPSPTITSLDIKNGAEGLTRKASFDIVCSTLSQAETISKFFLEPRFYVLVEWGWNTRDGYSQMAQLSNKNADLKPVCEMITYNNLGVRKKKRRDSKGEYDAFLGVITGGGIGFGDNETYILSVEITTTGEIPAYLQNHKGTQFTDSSPFVDSSDKFGEEEIKDAEELSQDGGDVDLGRLYFMKMFNALPAHKQITNVKSLIDESEINYTSLEEPSTRPWSHPDNFLNFDEKIPEISNSELSNGKVKANKLDENGNAIDGEYVNVELPTDSKIVDTDRYIRMGLAWKILNQVSEMNYKEETKCKNPFGKGNIKTLSPNINIDNTICRAHRNIFSADKSKLFIPNTQLPDFGLDRVLQQKGNTEDNDKTRNNWIELTKDTKGGYTVNRIVDVSFKETNIRFPEPNSTKLKKGSMYVYSDIYYGDSSFDDTNFPSSSGPYEWGFLKNLYINFDFFVSCLSRNGLFMKDVAYDILNGLSTAVNMYWNFQIVPSGCLSPDNKGNEELTVKDWNYIGYDINKEKRDTLIKDLWKIQTRGINSPFLSANLDMNIPGALANQIMAQRVAGYEGVSSENGNTRDANASSIEQKSQWFLFGNGYQDPIEYELVQHRRAINGDEDKDKGPIIKKQNGYTYAYSGGHGGTTRVPKYEYTYKDGSEASREDYESQTKKREDNVKSNFNTFVQSSGIFPRNKDRKFYKDLDTNLITSIRLTYTGGNVSGITANRNNNLDKFFIVGTFNDQKLLKQIENGTISPDEQTNKSPSLLPIKLTATLTGISGIKVGDIVTFTDLPHNFKNKLYQVFQVNHQIGESGWTTEIDFRMRNVGLENIDEVVGN